METSVTSQKSQGDGMSFISPDVVVPREKKDLVTLWHHSLSTKPSLMPRPSLSRTGSLTDSTWGLQKDLSALTNLQGVVIYLTTLYGAS